MCENTEMHVINDVRISSIIKQKNTGTGTGNSGRIALRFQYPGNEITVNTNNYQAALKNQFGGNDDINGIMWILQ